MPVVIPHTFVGGPGNKAKASEVNENFQALAAKFDAGIASADAAVNAGFKGSQLSTTPGERVGTANLENESVNDGKLAFDIDIPGLDSGRAVSGDHIKTLTAAHLARILPDSPLAGIGSNKLKVTFATAAISLSMFGGIPQSVLLTLSATFPKATYQCWGGFVLNIGGGAQATVVSMIHVSDSATNWAAAINAVSPATGSFTGTAVVIFTQKP